jgi:pilus assembly protein CpaE
MESQFMLEVLRAGVQDFLHRPLSSTELRELFDRILVSRKATVRMGSVMCFISNKGGVGKSTLAVNTACFLAERHPEEVLLIDASVQLGICALMLDLIPATTIVDAVREKERLDETLLRRLASPHPCGLHLLAAPADVTEAAGIDDESVARILNLARRTYRYTLVDTFPMLESLVMTIIDSSDQAFIVMQGTAPNVAGIVRFLPVLNAIGLQPDRQRIILNHNYKSFVGDLTINDIEGRLERRIDYFFPYKKKVLRSMNTGSPCILNTSRRFGFGLEIEELAEDIEAFQAPTADTSNELDLSGPEPGASKQAARA